MIKDKIKLIRSREHLEHYLKVNGISGKAKDALVKTWEDFQNAESEVAKPEIIINEVKTSVVENEDIELKEE